jgi:hypothetical protein
MKMKIPRPRPKRKSTIPDFDKIEKNILEDIAKRDIFWNTKADEVEKRSGSDLNPAVRKALLGEITRQKRANRKPLLQTLRQIRLYRKMFLFSLISPGPKGS